MAKLADVTRYVRSKAAGPFWITVDIFFPDDEAYRAYSDSPGLATANVASRLNLSIDQVTRIEVPQLHVLKFSYPRGLPQGGPIERDLHGGQQYARLLDLEV